MVRRGGLIFVVVMMLAALIAWFVHSRSEEAALSAMPSDERRLVFDETRQAFRSLCSGEVAPAMHTRCAGQAAFLARFPECDDACRRELERYRARATR